MFDSPQPGATRSHGAGSAPPAGGSPFGAFETLMREQGISEEVISLFAHYHARILAEDDGLLGEDDILPVTGAELLQLDELDEYAAAGKANAHRAVMIRLNGGLGTSMGMTYPKTLLTARDGMTFLDLILGQARETGWQLALMNSFSTDDDTRRALAEHNDPGSPLTFVQHMVPKVDRATLRPAVYPLDPELEWNPPGHGDIFASLFASGTLDALLESGRRYAFIANGDNLGAGPNDALLGYIVRNGIPFLMEVARRTAGDRKGGHLARLRDGCLTLRELAQCPKPDIDSFQNIRKYRLFNTNNIWIDLQVLREHIRRSGLPRLPMILNPKTVNPADSRTAPVYQVETAMGAAISVFPGAEAVVVPRSRFIPVKKCGDLLALRSDAYLLDATGRIRMHPSRKGSPLSVLLEHPAYSSVKGFEERFSQGAPSLLNCSSLVVRGDVRFEGGVTVEGDVEIINAGPGQAVVPEGSVLNGKIRLT